MSILYIEEKIKEKEKQNKIMKALSDIGLDPEEIPDLTNKEDMIIKYQEWVKESFFPEYEINAHKIISPKFGGSEDDRN
ncbi:MAG: hypothetical protein CMH62_03745 [Nanoarchaeota archaeon]|nr:hypothetical protein [Nanoarchaeota archaeon]